VRATEAVSAYVLFAGGRMNSLMPIAQFDQFEHLEQPGIQPCRRDDAAAFWERLGKERDLYALDVEAELIGRAKVAA
jgi:hypothetical protein